MSKTLQSMTGFASASASDDNASWTWELRSVNGRSLDVRSRLPQGIDGLEAAVKAAVAKRFQRGSVNVHLGYRPVEATGSVRIDADALELVTSAAERLRARFDGPPIRAETLLTIRGIVVAEGDDARDRDPQAKTAHREALLASLETALEDLTEARREEGRRLTAVMSDLVGEVAGLTEAIASHPSRQPDAVRSRLQEAIARLGNGELELAEDRLHQEAMLLATKADVEEEIARLKVHVASARDLIASGGAIGRKFDFLTQEFNREANTICSKSNDVEVTGHGLALKAVIDRMREQVQNIE
ncbi:MAG: YicC/YloC family endoribonuclease [Pseudomonadota bacterium]